MDSLKFLGKQTIFSVYTMVGLLLVNSVFFTKDFNDYILLFEFASAFYAGISFMSFLVLAYYSKEEIEYRAAKNA